jgi:hypothetical protein
MGIPYVNNILSSGFLQKNNNRDLLGSVKDLLEVVSMYHLDVKSSQLPLNTPTISVVRHFVSAATEPESEKTDEELKRIFKSLAVLDRSAGGRWDGRVGFI